MRWRRGIPSGVMEKRNFVRRDGEEEYRQVKWRRGIPFGEMEKRNSVMRDGEEEFR